MSRCEPFSRASKANPNLSFLRSSKLNCNSVISPRCPTATARLAGKRCCTRKVAHRSAASGPLIRATLIKLSEHDHFFIVVMHHIVSDGWSLVLFFQELAVVYEAFARGAQSPLRTLRYSTRTMLPGSANGFREMCLSNNSRY